MKARNIALTAALAIVLAAGCAVGDDSPKGDGSLVGEIGEQVAEKAAEAAEAERERENAEVCAAMKSAIENKGLRIAAEVAEKEAQQEQQEQQEQALQEEAWTEPAYSDPWYGEAWYAEPQQVQWEQPQADFGQDLQQAGVVYDNGTQYTWYSENVLPGGGLDELNSNGRSVDVEGHVVDGDGYIAVASSDYAIGTVIDTPWGAAKVYDTGCASGTVDVYTNW